MHVSTGLGATSYEMQKAACADKSGLSWMWCIMTDFGAVTPLPKPPAPGVPPPDIVAGKNVSPAEAQAIIDKLSADRKAAYDKALEEAWYAQAGYGQGNVSPEDLKACQWYQIRDLEGACRLGGNWFWGLVAGGGVLLTLLVVKRRD